MSENRSSAPTPFRDILMYCSGEGVNSLVMNAIFGFAMLYYTEALGLNYKLAALAMAVATFWDAVTDPVMGHISDNTRSRFGKRHPYMLVGGLASAACFYFIWSVPEAFQEGKALFWYLVGVNLLLRTTMTVYLIGHGALGFEVCTDYNQRATLQGVRSGFNMGVNLLGPALAWTLFFPDLGDVEATSVPGNYTRMGGAFTVAIVGFVLLVVLGTRKYMRDSRHDLQVHGNRPGQFLQDMREIITDRYPRMVFIFMAVVLIGIVLVSSLQMYVYVYFMKLTAGQKTYVHGTTMVACGLGSLLAPLVVRRLDKRPAVLVGALLSIAANLTLFALFIPGLVRPGWTVPLPASWPLLGGWDFPAAVVVFQVFHGLYWLGNGMMFPIAGSMMADVSEICKHRTGVLKDGGYGAMLSFITKTSMSVGLFFTGYVLEWVGFVEGADIQAPEAIHYLTIVMLLVGPAIALVALGSITRYPVNRAFMERIKAEIAARENAPRFE